MGPSAKVSVGHRASFVHAFVAFVHTISFISRSFFILAQRGPVPTESPSSDSCFFIQPITLTRVIDIVRSLHFTSFAPSVNTRTLRDGSLNSVGQSEVLIHHIEISDLHVEVHD